MSSSMRGAAAAVVALIAMAVPAWADPTDPAGPDIQPVAVGAEALPPVDDGKVASSPPETTKSPDGWTLTVGGKDETQRVIAPLTTALSTRDYEVGGVFTGSLKGPSGAPAPAKGVLEVGYQIGCGIDMSTGTGVLLNGNVGAAAGITSLGPLDVTNPFDPTKILLPNAGITAGGGVGVSLKPGIINTVPITKKAYGGTDPWVWVSHQRIKIDGCVGQSFIRSFAVLSKSTDEGDAIAAWYGTTKMV
ncbi:MAG: MspA family porin [Candidatus Nanopelagicales bacterium]